MTSLDDEDRPLVHLARQNVKVRLLRARLMLRERLTRVLGDEATQATPHQDHE